MAKPILIDGVASRQDVMEVSSTKFHQLGTRGYLNDGRVYYYAANRRSSALTRGDFHVQKTFVTNHVAQTQTTSGATITVGATRVNFDVGATALNLGDYEDGYLFLVSSTGIGQSYRIRNHTGSAGSTAITIDLYDPIAVAGSATTVASLYTNPFLDLQAVNSIAANGGVPLVTVTAGAQDQSTTARCTSTFFYWCQTWGPAPANFEATTAITTAGVPVHQSLVTGGRLAGYAAGTAESFAQAGYTLEAATAAQTRPVFLTCTP